ncbi:amino acid adenylation domain-containing protein [Micromonospora haikouensis]|uniref:Amino acid adenylation domain-containing protein n=1 Tax=Micromonospora haikouensis TaxID=686309 RepID=A0A1C4XH48_9ACTN|nr:non-ribosomal peptide synthetase [Micromonospora haikouensis]SCF07686.1 amino acid adenylation domain-containing protein [Micromonospora haikouensis]
MLPAVTDDSRFLASPAQDLLWRLDRAGAAVTPVRIRVRAHGPVDVARLAAAARATIQRHEAPRTTMGDLGNGTATQTVHPEPAPEAVAVDATGPDTPPVDIGADVATVRGQRLDLAIGPALRIHLVPAPDRAVEILVVGHPAVVDRTSLRLLVAELALRYAQPEHDHGRPLHGDPDEVLQYADFAAWHHDLLESTDGAAERRVWDEQLAASGPDPAPPVAGGAARTVDWRWAPEFTARLAALGAELGLRVPDLVAGVFAAVAARFTGATTVGLDVVDPARGYPALARAVGPFARTVPVPVQVDPDLPAADLLATFANDLAERRALIDHLDPRRAAPRGTTPRCGFEYAEAPTPITAGDVVLHVLAETDLVDAYPTGPSGLRLACLDGDGGMTLRLGYQDGTLTAAAAAGFGECLAHALHDLAERPRTPVGRLRLLTDAHRARLLARGRATEPGGWTRPVQDTIAEQAARTPDAVAVVAGPDELTYRDLDRRAERLADYLHQLGVVPGEPVLVSLDRRVELPVAVLGVLKAKAAFVPVDPVHPPRRLARLLADTGARVLIGTAAHRAEPLLAGARHRIVPTQDEPAVAAALPRPPLPPTGPDDLAYVLYTSGTTGHPSGVLVTHGGLANYLGWCVGAYGMRDGTGVLTHSSIGFDFTLTTLLAPLLVGQRVVLLADGGVTAVAAALRAGTDLTLVKLTPTHLDLLAPMLPAGDLAGAVRTLVVGGEALDARSIAPFRDAGTRVVNEYGPTETVVGSTAHHVGVADPGFGPVPIGRPIAGTVVSLRARATAEGDGTLPDMVPDGAVGELYIGGSGVAAGYLNQPELTRRRFLTDPADPDPGRWYRTGDLGRWGPGGVLEYLGRADSQVKVNGVRIEPGEIEAVLLDHPDVTAAVVVLRRDEDPGGSSPLGGHPFLAAYVVGGGPGPAVDRTALLRHCRERLPEQLVPRAVLVLPSLPLTVNGKLDRARLPKPDVRVRPDVDLVAPRTDVEEILANSVATVLGLDAVGIDDNYFALGGDSIRSIMVVSRAQARGVEVTVADLHAYPTVRHCAEQLRTRVEPAPAPTSGPFSLLSEDDRARIPAGVEDAFPLNLLQEGMIFHRDFAEKSAVYHAIASIRLQAPYDHDAMRAAIDQLVARHPMLRTSFDMSGFSRPLQLVHTDFASPLSMEDLRALPPPQRAERVDAWIAAEKARGFELHEYPLIRFRVHRLGDDEWQFTYGFHHEIVDGWSEALMIAELFSQYFAVVFDEPVALRPPTSSMRDAVALELEALRDRRNYEFWERYLAGATVMRLPRPAGGVRADKGAREIVRVEVPVPVELSDRLKQVARDSALPLKNVLMAAHLVVMSSYGGHADTLTYTVGNGRPESADGSSAIGLFVNSLALRVRTAGGTWRELMLAGLESERASMPYRRLPMAELKRHQGNEPLAETLFFFTNYHVFGVLDRWTERGVGHVATDLYGESTFPFCAIFRLNRQTGDLEVRLEYDSLQFSAELMAGIRECYAQALAAIGADPDAPYHTRTWAPPADVAHQRMVGWGPAAGADTRCLHHLVEQWAVRTPDAVAVHHEGTLVSYRELDRRANQLAHLLRANGVGPERIVGVLVERSAGMIVTLLAVLKAGGAYLPLDPAQPDEHLASVLADAGCDLVLAQCGLDVRLPAGARTVPVDATVSAAAGRPATAPATTVTPGNAAYLIYTSGSTGRPKGVVVEHRNAVRSTLARHTAYPEPVERYLLLSSYAFDSSVAGIFWTLSQGGTLLLPVEGAQREPAALADLVASRRPSHTLGVPSLLALLIDQGAHSGDLRSLRTVVSAGESCPADLAGGVARALPAATLHNEYGPTEATVWATVWSAPPGAPAAAAGEVQVPIGRPVEGTHVLPVNQHGHLVPAGVVGELRIGGAGVARGYHRRPAETAARFLPDPFAATAGGRWYATGDLGRILPSGDLEFHGRNDHQVKVQGFRVELGAVEALLDAHPSVRRAIVVAEGDATGDRRLVAYLAPTAGHSVSAEAVRDHVRERLPRYMVPAVVVVMDALPLTATGKIDRSALPAVGHERLAGTTEYVPPRNEVERAIAAIWCSVLKRDRVGVHERFFDIGGESLRAMQVMAATNGMFGTTLSVRTLFDAPTVGQLAARVGAAGVPAPDDSRGGSG